MSRVSLTASSEGIEKAQIARIGKTWTYEELSEELEITKQPIVKFFNGRPVDKKIFVQICQKLELDWQEIALLEQKLVGWALPTIFNSCDIIGEQCPPQFFTPTGIGGHSMGKLSVQLSTSFNLPTLRDLLSPPTFFHHLFLNVVTDFYRN